MSPQQVPPDPELTEVEAALGVLSPARSRIDRDRLMFLSGRASRRPPWPARWAWPSVAASLALLALGEAAALASRPATRVVERVVVVREVAPPAAPGTAGATPGDPSLRAPGPVPVVILRQASRTPAEAWSGPDLAGYARYRNQVLRLGPDAIPEPPPLVFQPGGIAPAPAPESSGALLRSEIDRLLNPGEPS